MLRNALATLMLIMACAFAHAASVLQLDSHDAYGDVSGVFTQVDGAPIAGANVWAQAVDPRTGEFVTFSAVRDVTLGNAYFRLVLPPGVYTLYAEANGTERVAFGTPLEIMAGCTAAVSFRLDGTGVIEGDCPGAKGLKPAPPGCCTPIAAEIWSPANGSTLPGTTVTFIWTPGYGIAEQYLMIGTSLGGSQIYGAYQGATATSRTLSGLASDGSTVYVRLMSYINGAWQTNDYTYTAFGTGGAPPPPAPSVLTTPAPSSTLSGTTVAFSWTAGSGVAERYFSVGTMVGGSQIYGAYQGAATSHTVSGLPSDGSTVYVRLMSYINGAWQMSDYTYTATSSAPTPPPAPVPSVLTTPAPGSQLTSSTVTFAWTVGNGVVDRYLLVGTVQGGGDIYRAYQGSATSRTVSGIPTTGVSAVYVTLMSYVNGVWQQRDYTYYTQAVTSPIPSVLTSPPNYSTLTSSTVTFEWDAGVGVDTNYLKIGTMQDGTDIYEQYFTGVTSVTVSGLPIDGRTLYVRLMSATSNGWGGAYRTYATASYGTAPAPSAMTFPAPGGTIYNGAQTFNWTPGNLVTERYLAVGTTIGGSNVYGAYQGAGTSRTVLGIPMGVPIYVRLMSYINGAWQTYDYTYASVPYP